MAGSVDALPASWPILLSSLLVGVGFAVGSASTAAVVPALVEPTELGAAVALNSVPLMLARAAGPAVGGGIAIMAGPAFACLLAAALNIACAILMASMRLPQRLGDGGDHNTALRLAVRHCLHSPRLLMVLIAVAALGLGAEPSVTLVPGIAERFGDATKAGWIASAFGVGGVAGLGLLGPLRRRLRHEAGSGWGLLLMGVGLALVAVGPVLPVALLGMALAGVGMTLAHANLGTLVQLLSPVDMRGRITALWFLCWLGARPVGAAVNGVLADALGVGWAVAGVSATLVAASWACRRVWRTPDARTAC
jgi:predicted MFS family arabinose efflux permease